MGFTKLGVVGGVSCIHCSKYFSTHCNLAPERLVLVLELVTWALSNCASNLLYQNRYEKKNLLSDHHDSQLLTSLI